jgi:hypothetical protein
MPELPEVYPTPPDLSRYTESTRRDLYDRLVAIQFTAPDPATVEHPEDVFTPYDPDAAGLMVFHVLGRWFATWTDLDAAPELPEDRRRELVRIAAAPDSPDRIVLYEV